MRPRSILASLSLCACVVLAPAAGRATAQPAPAAYGTATPLFPPGLLLDGRASSATYGRDTAEVVFVHWPAPGTGGAPRMLVTRKAGSRWTQPAPALPATGFFVGRASLPPGGERLYFETNRREPPVPGREDTDLWAAERQGEQWGDARPLGAPFDTPYNEHYVTVSAHGTLCFNSSRPEGLGENDLYCATHANGRWTPSQNLGPVVNSPATEATAFLDPDERFLLFASDRPGGYGSFDLYASVRRNGRWEAPENLGPAVNTPAEEWAPAVSPDGRRLLFQRNVGSGAGEKTVLYEISFDADRLHPPRDVRPGPGPRASHALVYDERQQQTVLLDGYQPPFPDTPGIVWTWDGRAWTSAGGDGPAARALAAAVYDARRDRIVSFGGIQAKGDDYEPLGDTWEWDGTRWARMADTGIAPRDHHAMAYDAARGRTVLFGGMTPGFVWATDTWEWDGAQWRPAATEGPAGRGRTAMAYDGARRQVVLFGGFGEGNRHFGDTWVWDGQRWRKADDDGPPARYAHAMAFDRRAGVVLLYGGDGPGGKFEDLWQWDGRRWTEVEVNGPGPGYRYSPAMVYDPARDRTILYGGYDGQAAYDDTWEWDGRQWEQVHPGNTP